MQITSFVSLVTYIHRYAVQRENLHRRYLLGRVAHKLATVRLAQRPLPVPLQRVQFVALRIVVADQRDVLAGQNGGGHVQREADSVCAGQPIVGCR